MDLVIEFNHSFNLRFCILNTPIAQLWLERMSLRDQWVLDDPKRFYSFGTVEEESAKALEIIQNCCLTINSYKPIIERTINNISDQDTLNYLHNIFERYHGLLDSQDTEFWNESPDNVKKALADLNLAVHRCESISRSINPRFVCTWYGMPKTETLTDDLITEYGTVNPKFGSVCLNYCEIGKTLEDLSQDRDNYIGDEAFKPFNYYSADFVVRLFEDSINDIAQRVIRMTKYYYQHKDFFDKRGYTEVDHPRLMPYRFPVAELVETMPREELLKQLRQNQIITKIKIE